MSTSHSRRSNEAIADLELAINALQALAAAEHSDDLDAELKRMRATATVTGDHPILVAEGRLTGLKRATKGLIRKSTRWYVETFAQDVRAFNLASLGAAMAAANRIGMLEARIEGLDRILTRLDGFDRGLSSLTERMVRSERASASHASARPPTPPLPLAASAAADITDQPADAFDYFGFELSGRGTLEEIRDRQRQYVELFTGQGPVLDIGCGRGEFLGLLRDAGVEARGVDSNADMVAHCRDVDLDVTHAEAIAHLTCQDPDSLGGLFAAQVVEHLAPAQLMSFLEAAIVALKPDGIIVLETMDPTSLVALRNYFADLTHRQPLVPETLAFLVESTGFRGVEIRYTSPVPDAGRLEYISSADLPKQVRASLNHNADLLNSLLFAPQDYAVIAKV